MANEARIEVVIGSAQAQAGANAVARAVSQVKQSFLDLSAKVFVAEQAVERVWRMAQSGAAFEETMGRLNRQMGQFHGTAQLMVNDLQAISNQTLSIDKAASLASRALAIGLDPDQIRTFTQAADVLDDVLGTDLPTAFDQIVQAAITGRSQVLANIGVYVDLEDEVRKLAVSTGRTTEQISRQERAMLAAKAIAGQTGDAMKRLSDGTVSDADKLKQYEKRWDDLGLAIKRFAKDLALLSASGLEKLMDLLTPEEHSITTMMKGLRGTLGGDPFQEVLGRAIVADTTGNLLREQERLRQAGQVPKPALPPELQAKQAEADRERRLAGLQGELDREKVHFDSLNRLSELDAQTQMRSQEEVARRRGDLRLEELDTQREFLRRTLGEERGSHERILKIAGLTTEQRIEEEERYRSKVFDINQTIRKVDAETATARQLTAAELAQARGRDEQARGERLRDQFQNEFEIAESLRRQDAEARQTYLQGGIDDARARFETDEQIAQRERELLRSQLAFKLRLSEEEVGSLLFFRKRANFEMTRELLGRADPTLSMTLKEGLLESGNAQDRRLMERANGDFFAGWARGLQDYVSRTEGAFNFANDMARRTAQTMEQGFQRFFFDGMDEKFRGFKDVLTGVLDFTKQIVSQIVAQMVMVGIVKPGASALSSFFGGLGGGGDERTGRFLSHEERFGGIERYAFGGIAPYDRFAMGGIGGITHRPQMMVMGGRTVEFGEGPQAEAFVPLPDGRTIPVTLRFAGALPTASPVGGPISVTMPVHIINQHEGAQVETRQSVGANGMPQLDVLIFKVVRNGFAEGQFDGVLRDRFSTQPAPVRR